jgi:hypothetical protein
VEFVDPFVLVEVVRSLLLHEPALRSLVIVKWLFDRAQRMSPHSTLTSQQSATEHPPEEHTQVTNVSETEDWETTCQLLVASGLLNQLDFTLPWLSSFSSDRFLAKLKREPINLLIDLALATVSHLSKETQSHRLHWYMDTRVLKLADFKPASNRSHPGLSKDTIPIRVVKPTTSTPERRSAGTGGAALGGDNFFMTPPRSSPQGDRAAAAAETDLIDLSDTPAQSILGSPQGPTTPPKRTPVVDCTVSGNFAGTTPVTKFHRSVRSVTLFPPRTGKFEISLRILGSGTFLRIGMVPLSAWDRMVEGGQGVGRLGFGYAFTGAAIWSDGQHNEIKPAQNFEPGMTFKMYLNTNGVSSFAMNLIWGLDEETQRRELQPSALWFCMDGHRPVSAGMPAMDETMAVGVTMQAGCGVLLESIRRVNQFPFEKEV